MPALIAMSYPNESYPGGAESTAGAPESSCGTPTVVVPVQVAPSASVTV